MVKSTDKPKLRNANSTHHGLLYSKLRGVFIVIVPNKAVPYDSSLLSKLPFVLFSLSYPTSPTELYAKVGQHFEDLNQFLLTLDTLFVLAKIDILNGDLYIC